MITSSVFLGKRYAVLGLARSGMTAAQTLLASGAQVTAWDNREEPRRMLAGRAELPLSLAIARSRGRLVDIRTSDLRFRPAEIDEFLERTGPAQPGAAAADNGIGDDLGRCGHGGQAGGSGR